MSAAAAIIAYTGSRIDQAGVWLNVPMDAYHGDLCVGPSISSSGLRIIEAKSPLHYFDTSYFNPDRLAPEDRPHFVLGRAVHELMLGETGFWRKYAVRPDEFRDWRRQTAQDWRDEMIAAGYSILVPEDLETIRGIAASLQREPMIQQGLFGGMVEASLVWQDAETGVWLKSRPDVFNPDFGIVADIKTTADASRNGCERAMAEYGYHMQLALVAEAVEALGYPTVPNDGHVLVFVEKARPYAVNLKPVDAWAIEKGRQQLRKAIRTFARCIEAGEWPSYPDSGMTCFLPRWLETRLKADDEAGLLPSLPAPALAQAA